MHRKRGQLQISFHAVFALVGGFLFLLFFFFLIKNVVMNEDTRDTRQLSYAVEAMVKTAASNPDEFRIVDLSDATYKFICNRGNPRESYLRIDDEPYRSLDILDHIPLFAPRMVKGDRLFTLTQTWSAPFQIGSFVFLSNNHTQYVLVGTSGDLTTGRLTDFIEEHHLSGFDFLPVSIDDLGSLEVQGHDRYRFVFFTGGPDSLNSDFKTKENSAIVVSYDVPYESERGTIGFYNPLKPTGNSPNQTEAYYGDEMLIAAIFADDYDTFICNMQKATEHLDTTLEILLRRVTKLEPTVPECATLLGKGKTLLNAYRSSPRAVLQSSSTLIDDLERINNQLYDCPTLY